MKRTDSLDSRTSELKRRLGTAKRNNTIRRRRPTVPHYASLSHRNFGEDTTAATTAWGKEGTQRLGFGFSLWTILRVCAAVRRGSSLRGARPCIRWPPGSHKKQPIHQRHEAVALLGNTKGANSRNGLPEKQLFFSQLSPELPATPQHAGSTQRRLLSFDNTRELVAEWTPARAIKEPPAGHRWTVPIIASSTTHERVSSVDPMHAQSSATFPKLSLVFLF